MDTTRSSGLLGDYADRIRYLQRVDLDDQGLRVPTSEIQSALRTACDLSTSLPIALVQVRALSRFWKPSLSQEADVAYFTKDVLAGSHGQRISLYFLVHGEARRVRLYLGAMTEDEGAAVRALLNSKYPGSRLWPEKNLSDVTDQRERQRVVEQWDEYHDELQGIRSFLNGCEYIGLVTGIPTPNVGVGDGADTQIDRLIRGLYGAEWALLVTAQPEEDAALVDMQLALMREQIRVQQEEGLREWRESAGQTVASHYHQLLEMRTQVLEACLFEGGWWVQSYICSPNPAVYQRAKALVKSVFSGDFSRVDRIRVLDCPGAGPKAASFSPIVVERAPSPSRELSSGAHRRLKYHTLLSSGLLSALVHLPRVEMPGYYVQESALFDVSSHVPSSANAIPVGEILDHGHRTGNSYRVRVEDLTKHCLVVGITGSGKTNTTFYLLQQLQRQDPPIPFLVIEPAKREYRQLARLLPADHDLSVFTVGEEGERAAPFRLNPFEIRPGVPVQTHIDLLKSVFNASFGMWTPLPQILERAIHEIYRDKGWDPVYSANERAVIGEADGESWHPDAQPTLTDLYHKVADMVPKLGYDKEVTRNVRTALETRINSLRVGAKGLMLDTPSSIPIEYLLDGPTVLELEGVGDDDEKAFIMGLILIALYEHYRVQGPPSGSDLGHVTVIEEAHRLLTNVPTGTDPEASNLRGKAVETFVNMLSEVRAYGEGFFIAEQIPTKLSSDVIKNTALKVMHRTVANDDREVMGGAMNLNPAQLRHVVALGTGEAVVHGGGHYGDDNAILVKVPLAKGEGQKVPTGAEIRTAWERFRDRFGLASIYLPYPTCETYCGGLHPKCADARRIAEDPAMEDAFSTFTLSLVTGSFVCSENALPQLLTELYDNLAKVIRARIAGPTEDLAWMRCILSHGLHHVMAKRGGQYEWKYRDVERMVAQLLPAVLATAANRQAEFDVATGLRSFCEAYEAHCHLEFEPFYGCGRVCGASPLCIWRYHVEPLLHNEVLTKDFTDAGGDIGKLAAVGERASRHVIVFPANSVLEPRSRNQLKQIAGLCFAIQQVHSDPSTWPVAHRQHVIDELLKHYSGEERDETEEREGEDRGGTPD